MRERPISITEWLQSYLTLASMGAHDGAATMPPGEPDKLTREVIPPSEPRFVAPWRRARELRVRWAEWSRGGSQVCAHPPHTSLYPFPLPLASYSSLEWVPTLHNYGSRDMVGQKEG